MSRKKTYTPEEVIVMCDQYMNQEHVQFIKKAYEYAKNAHKGQMRKSGEEFITHPVQVAGILADIRMDPVTIATGFLHDVVEDTPATYEDIHVLFSQEVADLVEGVTKLGTFKFKSRKEHQAENHRKMLLAMARDVRVVIVKLADRLHNMRTLKYHRPEKQKEIAMETLEIYAPLANHLGMSRMKWELEDTALHYINPEAYYEIVERMNSRREDREKYIAASIEAIEEAIAEINIKAEIYGRPKHIYSIYRKMVDQNKEFSEIFDLLGIRVLVDSVKDCYAVLGAIHTQWKPMPGRFKDYIAMPKQNMYQSLHTTVLGPKATPLEVQIRTYQMHEIAEFGVAAHWAYKEGNTNKAKKQNLNQQLSWFRDIIEFQSESEDAGEFMEAIKQDILTDKVYVFTPAGEVMELPEGSSTLDFAYHVHSEVGTKATGARVNSRMVPLDYQLKTGDIVEIITSSSSSGPSRDWLNFVNTSKARNKIKHFFKIKDRDKNIERGRQIIEDLIREMGFEPKQILKTEKLEELLERYPQKTIDDFFAAIGFGELKPVTVVNRLTEEERKHREKEAQELDNTKAKIEPEKERLKIHHEDGVIVEGMNNMLLRISKCCNPVPGDDIVGYITRGRGISIHRKNCPNLKSEGQERLIEVEWVDTSAPKIYDTNLEIRGYDRSGLLNDILQVVNADSARLSNVQGRIDNDQVATISMKIGVNNRKRLNELISKIKRVPDVYQVKRIVK